ncbi:MAG: amidase [Cellulosilyticum sp.]|nr:amidase [Cellulosilyticum sp.]
MNRLSTVPYNREAALSYAKTWSLSRNPKYYDFSEIGGDCTNFISQCIYAGCHTMNPTQYVGWYYYNVNNRSASWTGVPFFYKFMINNKGVGPYMVEVPSPADLLPGDVIQFANPGQDWHHNLLVLQTGPRYEDVLIATHTNDAYNRPLSTYNFAKIRFLHIENIRRYS